MAASGSNKITTLDPIADDPMTVRVKVGRRVVATLARSRCSELGVAEGRTWTLALQRRVAEAAACDAAREAALRALGRRAYSQAGLQQKLVERGHEARAAEAAVRDLADHGWLDDATFAELRAESLNRRAPMAAEAIAGQLQDEGVAPELAESTAREAAGSASEVAAALAREARAARKAGLSMRTLAGRLARRGFDQDTVETALRAGGYPVDDA
jgi:regulatory protein